MVWHMPGSYRRPERIIPLSIVLGFVIYYCFFTSSFADRVSGTYLDFSPSDLIDAASAVMDSEAGVPDYLEVTLMSLKDNIIHNEAVDVEVFVKNKADHPVTLLKWKSPFDDRASMIGLLTAKVVSVGDTSNAKREAGPISGEKLADILAAKKASDKAKAEEKAAEAKSPTPPKSDQNTLNVEITDETPKEHPGQIHKSPTVMLNRRLPPPEDAFMQIDAGDTATVHLSVPWPKLTTGTEYAIQMKGFWMGVWPVGLLAMNEQAKKDLSGGLKGDFESNEVLVTKIVEQSKEKPVEADPSKPVA